MYATFLLLWIFIVSVSGRLYERKTANLELVIDYEKSDRDKIITKHDGDFFQCDKFRIDDLKDGHCSDCMVKIDTRRKNVYCLNANIPRQCINKSCVKVANPNDQTKTLGLKEIKDYEPHEMYGVLLIASTCKTRCISKKNACSDCVVDTDLAVYCPNGQLPIECYEICCSLIQ